MEEILKDINRKCVKIEEEQEKKNTRLINDVCTTIICELKKDELFNFLFQGPVYTGSYYKGLKIKKADEYDINLVLVLPKEMRQQCQMDTEAYPGTASLNLGYTRVSQNRIMFEKIKSKLCKSDYLDCSKVNEWFEGLVQKALNTYPYGNYDAIKISMRKYGPAKTLIINDDVHLDLVPCFEFDRNLNPLPNYNQLELNKYQDKSYLLVPKISKDRIQHCPELYWRVSFPKQEQQCINNVDKLKAGVRLLKLIRDDRNHKPLSSYFIQTVAMHQVEEIKTSKTFLHWTLSETFLILLECLIYSVTSRSIPFFWLEEFNLLADCNQTYLRDLEGFLKRMKLRIQQDPENVKKHINYPQEKQVADVVEPGQLMSDTGSSLSSTLGYLGIAAGTAAAIGAVAYACTRDDDNGATKQSINRTYNQAPRQSVSSRSGLTHSGYPRVQNNVTHYAAPRQSQRDTEVDSLSSSLGYLGIAAGIAAIGGIAYAFTRDDDNEAGERGNRRDK